MGHFTVSHALSGLSGQSYSCCLTTTSWLKKVTPCYFFPATAKIIELTDNIRGGGSGTKVAVQGSKFYSSGRCRLLYT